MKSLLVCMLVIAGATASAQVRRDRITPFTIRGNIGIPKPISSARFHQSFAGLYEGNISFNLRVAGNLSAGLGYQSTNFKTNKFLRMQIFQASLPYYTTLLSNGGFVRLGYDHFTKPNIFVSYALNSGFMFLHYNRINPDSSALNLPIQATTFTSTYLQPEVAFNFLMEQRLAFSVFLSYTTLFYRYDARAPRLNHFEKIQSRPNNYLISYFNFGFGFTVLLGK